MRRILVIGFRGALGQPAFLDGFVNMITLSVFITTDNNGRTLATCLESVKWVAEIVGLDSYSTDETVDIAKRYGVRLLQHEFTDYGRQKQMALEKTTHDWVLLLDADEALSRDLQSKIRQVLASGPAADVRHSTPGTIILADV